MNVRGVKACVVVQDEEDSRFSKLIRRGTAVVEETQSLTKGDAEKDSSTGVIDLLKSDHET